MAIEILPKIELADFKGIQLARMNAEVTDTEVEEALSRSRNKAGRSLQGRGAKAKNGDRVTMDFTGKMDGEPFEGGTGGDVSLHLGRAG